MGRSNALTSPINKTACPACGSGVSGLYAEKYGVRVVRCSGCSLVYNAPLALANRPEAIYGPEYFQSKNHDFGYEDYLSAAPEIRKTFIRRLRLIERLIPKGRMLDAGCACGYFLDIAKAHGWEAYGVDLSAWAIDQAKARHGDNAFCGPVEKAAEVFGAASFDLVTMWDLLEQVPDPLALFSSIHGLLKPQGYCIFLMRDIDSFIARCAKDRWIHFRPREKYLYFSSHSIEPLLNRAGFCLVRGTTRAAGMTRSLSALAEKLDYYSPQLAKVLNAFVRRTGLDRCCVYLNFLDTKIILAQKT